MNNPVIAAFLTTTAVARFHDPQAQTKATWAIAGAKQPRGLPPVQPLMCGAVSHLPPLTPEPTPAPEPEPAREPEPLPDQDPEPRPGQEPLWSLLATGFMPITVATPKSAIEGTQQALPTKPGGLRRALMGGMATSRCPPAASANPASRLLTT